jgi:hypothetical protein
MEAARFSTTQSKDTTFIRDGGVFVCAPGTPKNYPV